MQNPLDQDDKFTLTLCNPNPTSSKTKDGPIYRVSFELTQDEWQWFMDTETKGMVMEAHHVAVTHRNSKEVNQVTPCQEPEPEHMFSYEAQQLWIAGFFYQPSVWAAVGSPQDYMDHIKRLPSCISKRFSGRDEAGAGYCDPCHVRRADNAGTGIKPDYWVVPMTHDEHSHQHQHGELSLLIRTRRLPEVASETNAKDWFNKKAMAYVSKWAEDGMKSALGYDKLNQVPPEAVILWADDKGLYDLLPECHKAVYENAGSDDAVM